MSTQIRTGNYRDARGIVLGGGLAGIIAGIVMAIFAMAYAGMTGMGFWTPLRLIAGALFGADALTGGGGVLLAGAIIHMMASAAFGIIFAALVPRTTGGGGALALGIIYAIAVWVVMTYLVVPIVNPTMSVRIPVMAGAFWFEHVIFGAVLGITPGLVRSLSKRPPDVIEERRAA
jgi:hypothetical protein